MKQENGTAVAEAEAAFEAAVSATQAAEARLAGMVRDVRGKERAIEQNRRATDEAHRDGKGEKVLNALRAERRELVATLDALRDEMGEGDGPHGLHHMIAELQVAEHRAGVVLAQARRVELMDEAREVVGRILKGFEALRPDVRRLKNLRAADAQERATARAFVSRIEAAGGEVDFGVMGADLGSDLLGRVAGRGKHFLADVLPTVFKSIARVGSPAE